METVLSGARPLCRRSGDSLRFFTFAIFLIMASLLFGGCVGKEPSQSDLFSANRPPIANAGPDQNVESGASVQLDGSQSVDPQGVPIAYTWTMTEKPAGSSAALNSGEAVNPNFVADVDGQYRFQLVVSEKVDISLPVGVPISSVVVPTSGPDEVVITAGRPGPFPNSGNKLLLDGKHFGITILPMNIGGNTSLTAEGWFWIDRVPPAGQETLLFGKEGIFDLVLKENSTVVFRWFTTGPTELPQVSLTLKEWHHLVAVIDQSRGRAYLAVDGKISAGSAFTGSLATKNETRFVIGGGEAGKAFLFGMADEVRVTQDIRYPETDFTPPSGSLTQDNPFVDSFQNTVHGLWRFDERAGSTLFLDISLRTNDLFLVTETGFRPFGRMAHARVFHTALTLKNEDIWMAGGIDDGGNSVVESEVIDFATNQILPDATINLETEENVVVTDNQIGVGDGSRNVFSTTLPFSPLGQSMTIKTDAFRVTDNSQGQLVKNSLLLDETKNNVSYSSGVVTVQLPALPAPGEAKIVATLIDPTGPPAVVTAESGAGNTMLVKGVPKGNITSINSTTHIATVFFPLPISEGSVVVTATPARLTGEDPTDSSNGILTGGGIFGKIEYAIGKMTVFFASPPTRRSVIVTVGVTVGNPLVSVQDFPDPNVGTPPIPSPTGKLKTSTGTEFGTIHYQTGEMDLDFTSIVRGTVKVEANSTSINATDRQIGSTSTGSFSGDGITSGTVDYNSRTVTVDFSTPIAERTVTVTVGTGSNQVIATDVLSPGGFTVGGTPVIGTIDYNTGTMSVVFPSNVSLAPTTVAVHAFSRPIQVTDISDGKQGILSGPGIFLGTVNHDNGELGIDFLPPPADLSPVLLGYRYKRKSGISDHTATLLDDGKVLVAGGQNAGPIIGTPQKGALLFNPADDSVVKTGPMATARRFHTAGLLSDKSVLVVGGEGGSDQALNSSERFVNGQFSGGPILKQARKLHRMINLKECLNFPAADRVLVVGGYDSNHIPLASAEIYDPADQRERDFVLTAGSMATPRAMHTLTCLPDGKVLVAGGVNEGGAVTFTAEIFDPSTGRFGPVEGGGMIFSRAGHTATVLSDGKILIAGGLNQFQLPLSNAEIYDPVQKVFTVLPTALGFARFGHIALPWKGSILFIGGAGATGRGFSLVESYVP